MNVEKLPPFHESLLIKEKDTPQLDLGAIRVREVFSNKTLSLAVVQLDGINNTIINRGSDSFYFVQDGEGTFTVNGNEVRVEKGDTIFIPKDTPYFDSGNMTLFVVTAPPFDRDQIESLE